MADKTEAPSSKRLEESRAEGKVAKSTELNAAVIMLTAALLLRGPGASLALALQTFATNLLVELPQTQVTQKWLDQTFLSFIAQILPSVGIIIVGLLVVGVATTVGQTGFLWSSKRVGVNLSRLNPLEGFKRIFSSNGWIELARSLIKLSAVGYLAYSYLRNNYVQLIGLNQYDFRTAAAQFAQFAISLTINVGMGYFVLAIADYIFQRWRLMKSLRMSKEEVKEEHKRSEGDPFMKSRIRQQMRRMARQRMMSAVPRATVIVTNPTHLAIAIEYTEGMKAPRVLAKGAMLVAQKIVAIAKENSIPIVQNIPLAHAIYKTVEIDHEISPELYMAMAEVLAYVYRLRGKYSVRQQSVLRPVQSMNGK